MKRGYVTVNMASSIDGKIASKARGPVKLGSAYDSQRMGEIRSEADAVVMGARTFLAYPKPLLVKEERLVKRRLKKGMQAQPATVVVSSKLNFPRNTLFENAQGVRRIIFCTNRALREVRERLKKNGVEVIVWPGRRPSARFILKKLSDLGLTRVLLEGGGELNAQFFEESLVDRVYLTLCPSLVGGRESPTIFEGKGFPLPKRSFWRLTQSKKRGDELYLIYDAIR